MLVFLKYVTNVLLYASEIWGWHKSGVVEKVHVNFCKKVLGMGPKGATNLMYYELGIVSLPVKMKLRIFMPPRSKIGGLIVFVLSVIL